MSLRLISSPLQGFTDFHFRNSFNKYFDGIDLFYSPYMRLNKGFDIKSSYERDILPKNNSDINVIPQIMTSDADEFLFMTKYIQGLGYNEVNWNLGCPYPMVAKRGMGSGLIQYPDKIDKILSKVYSDTNIAVSIKLRLGYEDKYEILKVLQVLEAYPIKNIGIHPRTGKQLYKGEVDLNTFTKCLEETNHEIHYNGDIRSVVRYRELKELFPSINNYMLGRWLIADPFLPSMIKNDTTEYPENRIEIFSKFHDTLFEEFHQALSGPSHLLMKMYHYWEYFILPFNNTPKGLKLIKKAKNLNSYKDAVNVILNNEMNS